MTLWHSFLSLFPHSAISLKSCGNELLRRECSQRHVEHLIIDTNQLERVKRVEIDKGSM